MTNFQDRILRFAHHLEKEQLLGITQGGHTTPVLAARAKTKVVKGNKYWKVDIDDSGRYMVDAQTEEIFGIKAYGQVHKGKKYGTLSTFISWDWKGYYPSPRIPGVVEVVLAEDIPVEVERMGKPVEKNVIPVVGMGCTYSVGSDSYPYTVISVVGENTVVVQEDDYDATTKTFTPRHGSTPTTLTFRKNGCWAEKNHSSKRGGSYSFGERRFYLDRGF